MTLAIDSKLQLPSGHAIPQLGYGVYQARSNECENGIREAIKVGYRHIDSAQAYRNENIVGLAAIQCGPEIPRSSIFLTTKYMSTHKVYPSDDVYKALTKSLKKIDQTGATDAYIDLMLIHAPFGGVQGRANNWDALARAQKEGWVRDIGVSNFNAAHLEALPSPKPAINQIELHPFCQQREIVHYCQQHGILVQAYSPLIRGDEDKYRHPVLVEIARKHGKDIPQVLIRWSLQKGYIPLPKSVTPKRIRSNAEVYDFELDLDDMARLDELDQGAQGAITWNPVDQP